MAFFDPDGNGTNTAWTGDYTGIDDAVRSPTSPVTSGDGASISTGTATALEDTLFSSGTHVAGATYTLYIHSESGLKRGLAVSVDGGSNFSTIHGASAAAAWRTLDVSGQVTSQATLDGFAVRWRCDATVGGAGAGTVTVHAAYLDQVTHGIESGYATAGVAAFGVSEKSGPTPGTTFVTAGLGMIGRY